MPNLFRQIITYKHFITFFVLLIGISILFVLLQPKVSALIFKQKRSMLLQSFMQTTNTEDINPQNYWKLREFYSPGFFIFNKTGINLNQLQTISRLISVNFSKQDIPILIFKSPFSKSIEILTTSSDIKSFITPPSNAKIIKENTNEIIYITKNLTIIGLLLPISEMQKANGFFDYNDIDKNLFERKNWFTVTAFNTN